MTTLSKKIESVKKYTILQLEGEKQQAQTAAKKCLFGQKTEHFGLKMSGNAS